jgi:membrane protein YdbS with pleckstrin-like domain
MNATAKDALFPGQHEGEEIVFFFRQHPLVMRKSLVLGLLAILVAVLPLDFPFAYNSPGLSSILVKVAVGVTVVVLAYWIYRYCLWYYSVFIITGERTVSIHHRSFFHREVRALFHGSVHSVDYTVPGLQGALFGFGNITVYTWVGNFPIDCVHHPEDLHQQLLEVIRNSRERPDPPAGDDEVQDGR